jgi:hypothetical protein
MPVYQTTGTPPIEVEYLGLQTAGETPVAGDAVAGGRRRRCSASIRTTALIVFVKKPAERRNPSRTKALRAEDDIST